MPDPQPPPEAHRSVRPQYLVCFGLFAIFFVFYAGAALLQTPVGKAVAILPVFGMPLGLLMSLAIFPVSWILIALWFWKAK